MEISTTLSSSFKKPFPARFITLLIIIGVLLSGCVMTGESLQVVEDTKTPQPTMTFTQKPPDTLTPTATYTPTPTITVTLSITPSPTSVFIRVGHSNSSLFLACST